MLVSPVTSEKPTSPSLQQSHFHYHEMAGECQYLCRKLGRSFYLNPDRDIFWLSTDMADYLGDLERLKGYYTECCGRIKSVLVSWEEYAYESYPKHVLPHITGLHVVQVLLREEDDKGHQLKTENQEEAEKEDGTEDDNSDMKFAREMIERDSAMAMLPWTVHYMYQKRNVFCQWSRARGAVEGVCVYVVFVTRALWVQR